MGSEISSVKKVLRQQIRAALSELSEKEKEWSDRELIARFLEHPALEGAETVLLYWGVGTEIDTSGLVKTLLEQGRRVCLPKCLPDHQMEARLIRSEEDLEPDAWNIPAPKDGCEVIPREDLDLILVPASVLTAGEAGWAREAATMTATWRTSTARPSACAGRTSSRSTCPGSPLTPGCGMSSPRTARSGP